MGRFGLRDELQIKKYPQPEHFGPLSGLVIYSFMIFGVSKINIIIFREQFLWFYEMVCTVKVPAFEFRFNLVVCPLPVGIADVSFFMLTGKY